MPLKRPLSAETSVSSSRKKSKKPIGTSKPTDEKGSKVEVNEQDLTITTPKKAVRSKSKAEDDSAPDMLIARTLNPKILVGAHVSAAGGVQNAINNSHRIGGNAFALFLKNQRQWAFQPLSEEHESLFLENCKKHYHGNNDTVDGCKPIVPHGSYLVNLAHTDPERAKQAYTSFLDDLSRCRRLGIRLYNFHPGNAVGATTRQDALKQLAKQLNTAHKDPESGNVITLLETMAAVGGNTIGCTFEELAEIIALVDDKSRIGVCLDTCHVFAAGYDLRTPEAYARTMRQFEDTIGLKYLKAFHVNDSKAPLGSGKDLHYNIGLGYLGLKSFWNLVNDNRMWGLPFILETPTDAKVPNGETVEDFRVWGNEIKLLERLVGMDTQNAEFKELEAEFARAGQNERDRVGEQVNKKLQKVAKKKDKPNEKEKGSKDIRNMF